MEDRIVSIVHSFRHMPTFYISEWKVDEKRNIPTQPSKPWTIQILFKQYIYIY